jgi:four helix bundle protein
LGGIGRWRIRCRGASISIASNIAEGFERYSRKEFGRFLGTAKGSCGELRSQLHIAMRVGRIEEGVALELIGESEQVSKIIGGLRASLDRKKED